MMMSDLISAWRDSISAIMAASGYYLSRSEMDCMRWLSGLNVMMLTCGSGHGLAPRIVEHGTRFAKLECPVCSKKWVVIDG